MPRRDPILRLERQRAEGDCAIACLASITGRSYEDVLIEAAKEKGRSPHEEGLYLSAIIRVAERLGYPVRNKRPVNLVKDKGIVSVHYCAGHEHVLILMAGLIFETFDCTVWLPEEYQKEHRAKFTSVLVPI
jgi:hypothetical protein